MSNRKRLLGVIVPSKRAAPNTEDGNADYVLVVQPPPFIKERRDKLDATELQDYNSMTDDELKALIRERGLGLRGRRMRAHYIKALEAPEGQERQDLKEYQVWKDSVRIRIKVQRGEHIPLDRLTPTQRDLVEQAEWDRRMTINEPGLITETQVYDFEAIQDNACSATGPHVQERLQRSARSQVFS
jgi:hypothetical protein